MATIIQFPKKVAPKVTVPIKVEAAKKTVKAPLKPVTKRISAAAIVWHIAVLCSPLIEFVMKWDCLYQFCRMFYYWDTPGMHSGWTFLFHFFLLAAFQLYVVEGKPK